MSEKIIEECISVEELGSGWAAVHRVLVAEHDDIQNAYWDIQQTGVGRYRTRTEALQEAVNWSESDEIPLKVRS